MTPAEAAVLLGGISAFDNRKPDETAAKMWAHALADLRLPDCAEAVTQHFATSTDYLMPAHIRAIVRRIRAQRIAEHPLLEPPPELTGAQEREWRLEINARIGDGETFDPDQFRGELKARDMRELTAGQTIDSGEAVANLRSQVRRPVSPPSKPTDPEHARRKEQARAELDAIRTNPSTDADQGAGEQQEAS
jgi:hypothetical protein